MKKNFQKILCSVLVVLMLCAALPLTAFADDEVIDAEAITREYGDFSFTKISNPAAGSGEPDGINTNDVTGFDANRLNSYAWAVASRGDYIYIGTNRTLFGSALNAVTEEIQKVNDKITPEMMGKIASLVSGGEVPVNLEEEDYIPQIIKFDVQNGTTEVIYQHDTARGDDGILYYTDRDGNIIPAADVSSETASFRSVIEYKGNLYFGSLGVNMLQLVRVDADDNAEVVFQTLGLTSSLRACCKYGEGDEETVYFGGQDTTYAPWLEYRFDPSNAGDNVLPIVIRSLDPATAGTDNEDWSNIIADFRDFGQYARASVYVTGGGNVWDLCNYNNKLYLILAFDRGWAMFRGEKAEADDPDANEFGWKWTEIVGDDSIYGYPLAMDEQVGALNEEFRIAYGCTEYTEAVDGAGLLESTATPYVFNGKMYIGSFDNATCIQAQTVIKLLTKLQYMINTKDISAGPTLKQIFAPIYEVLTHQQHIWVMDDEENIAPVDDANKLLEGTTNDYVWRFIEYDGKLYTGTFDSATAYTYFVDLSMKRLIKALKESITDLPGEIKGFMDGSFLSGLVSQINQTGGEISFDLKLALQIAIGTAGVAVQGFMEDEVTVERLYSAMQTLQGVYQRIMEKAQSGESASLPEKIRSGVGKLLSLFDVEGLKYWIGARKIVRNAKSGFDIFCTNDGEYWDTLVQDGLGDPYNYGARTFTICSGELYVGTANPYYGAQLWKIKDNAYYSVFTGMVEHGDVAFDIDYAPAGTTITVTPEPMHNYHTESVTVTDFNDNEIEVTGNGDGTFSFIMPGRNVWVSAAFEEECPSAKYYDVDTMSWYHEAVDYVVENGLMAGVAENSFDPNGATTRAMLVTVIYRLEGAPEVEGESPFDDVKGDEWFANAVKWAYANGIVSGYGDGAFGPSDKLTREQIAAIMYSYAVFSGRDTSAAADLSGYEDAVEISEWALPAMQWANAEGLILGYSKTRIAPLNFATRAEVATILMNYIESGNILDD